MIETLNIGIPLWIFAVVFGYAVVITIFCFYRNPLPFPDNGHRLFAVVNEEAAKAVVTIMDIVGGLPERFTFDPGTTHQTVLWDNTTVIIYHDEDMKKKGLPLDGISIEVDNPELRSRQAKEILENNGFKCDIHRNILPEAKDKFVMITSDAFFPDRGLGLRRHILKMGKPPGKRKLFDNKEKGGKDEKI